MQAKPNARNISWPACAAIAGDWMLIAVAIASALHLNTWWANAVAFLLVARTQLALGVMMHEAAHGLLAKSRPLNNVLGQWCCAAPLFLSMLTYRAGHLKHHKTPMAADDPVACVFDVHGYPIARQQLWLKFLSDLTTFTYWRSIYKTMRGDYKTVMPPCKKSTWVKLSEVLSILLVNGLLFACLAFSGHAASYFYLWLLPALCLLPLLGRVRAIMEHAAYPMTDNQAHNARTIIKRNWQTFWFGPHHIHYHIEHHLHPKAYFDTLPSLHTSLKEQGVQPPNNLYTSYWAIIREVTF